MGVKVGARVGGYRSGCDVQKAALPIRRRFGCKLLVVVVIHAYEPRTRLTSKTRMMVVLDDKIKYDKLAEWLHSSCGVGASQGFSLEFASHSGVMFSITDRMSFQSWLDSMWMHHPPVLHVYHHEHLVQQAGDNLQERSPSLHTPTLSPSHELSFRHSKLSPSLPPYLPTTYLPTYLLLSPLPPPPVPASFLPSSLPSLPPSI